MSGWVQVQCLGGGSLISNRLTGPGRYECPDCKQFVPMMDGRIKPHERDEHWGRS